MGNYIVYKHHGHPQATKENEFLVPGFLAEHREPGKDFVKIFDATSDTEAKKEATAYWDGTHENPEKIDAWVMELKD